MNDVAARPFRRQAKAGCTRCYGGRVYPSKLWPQGGVDDRLSETNANRTAAVKVITLLLSLYVDRVGPAARRQAGKRTT